MARIRTFIAVDLGEAIRERAVALQEQVSPSAAGVKWVEKDNLHITLLFLGEVQQLDVNPICRTLKKQLAAVAPFTLEVTGLGAFPTLRRPKILWAGLSSGADELKAIHDRIEEPILNLGGYRRESRAFAPHLTLGRLSQEEDRAETWGPLVAQYADWQGGAIVIDEVLVMRSELLREGPVYSIMGRAPLLGKRKKDDDE